MKKITFIHALIAFSICSSCSMSSSFNCDGKDGELQQRVKEGIEAKDLGKIAQFILTEKDFDINAACEKDRTILQQAVYCDYYELAEFLLKYNADPNKKDGIGNTALMLAAESNNEGMAKLLLAYNADTTLTNNYDDTALTIATKKKHQAIVDLIKHHQTEDPPVAEVVPQSTDQRQYRDSFGSSSQETRRLRREQIEADLDL